MPLPPANSATASAVPRLVRRGVSVALVALLVALTAATVVAPRSMAMLVVSVVARELSPALALASLVGSLAVLRLLRGEGRCRTVLAVLLLCTAAVAILPYSRFTRTSEIARTQIDDAAPAEFGLATLVRGIPSSADTRERTVRYTAADGSPLAMRVYLRDAAQLRPAVVVVHGGAWRGGSTDEGSDVSRGLAARGYAVVSVDYRTAPAHPFPAARDDVRRALEVVADSAAAWRIDTARVALLGRSAGGQLALLAAYERTPVPPRIAPAAVVALYAPWDLARGYREPPSPDPIDARAVLHDFIGGTPGDQPDRYRDASPSSWVRRGLPPTLLLFGGQDHVVQPDFPRSAARALRAVAVPVVAVELPWAEHGFDMVPGGMGSQLAYATISAFLTHRLGAPRR